MTIANFHRPARRNATGNGEQRFSGSGRAAANGLVDVPASHAAPTTNRTLQPMPDNAAQVEF